MNVPGQRGMLPPIAPRHIHIDKEKELKVMHFQDQQWVILCATMQPQNKRGMLTLMMLPIPVDDEALERKFPSLFMERSGYSGPRRQGKDQCRSWPPPQRQFAGTGMTSGVGALLSIQLQTFKGKTLTGITSKYISLPFCGMR